MLFNWTCFICFNWTFNLQFYCLRKGWGSFKEWYVPKWCQRSHVKSSAKLFQCNILKVCLKIFGLSENDFFSFSETETLTTTTSFKTLLSLITKLSLTWPTSGCGGRKLGCASLPNSSVTTTPGESRGRAGGERGFQVELPESTGIFCGRCVFFPFVKGKTLVTLCACCKMPVNCYKKSLFDGQCFCRLWLLVSQCW